jgi:tetratricopeptide (TPR) repeat protein
MALSFVVVSLFAIGNRAALAEPTATAPTEPPAIVFEREIHQMRTDAERAGRRPEELISRVMEQLKAGRAVTDETVLEAVNASAGAESRIGGSSPKYPSTKKLIEDYLSLTAGMRRCQAWLYQTKGALLEAEHDLVGAAKAFQVAVGLLTASRNENDLRRLDCLRELGNAHLRTGDAREAEKAYLEVLSYDWFKVADGEVQQRMVDDYRVAARGLIALRRHNAAALSDIHFVPAMEEELGPERDAAIKEAKTAPGSP